MLYVNRNAEQLDDTNEMPLLGTPKLKSFNAIWPEPDEGFRKLEENSTHPTLNLKRGDVLSVRDGKIRDELCTTESCWSGEF